jgi:uncharacterized protein (DUF697 family)
MKTDAKPTPKVAATGIAGIAATVLVIIADALGLNLPPEVAAAVVAAIAFAAGYLKKGRKP